MSLSIVSLKPLVLSPNFAGIFLLFFSIIYIIEKEKEKKHQTKEEDKFES